MSLQPARRLSAHSGTSCRQRTFGWSAAASLTIVSSRLRRPGGLVLPWKTFQLRTSSPKAAVVYEPMRVVLADPPAFTPPYDHDLAAALARAGADVELVTSRFRFGAAPTPSGYRRRELFYPLSSRLFRRSRLRLPLKVLEHPLGLARLAATAADVVHMQWLAAPEADVVLLRHR